MVTVVNDLRTCRPGVVQVEGFFDPHMTMLRCERHETTVAPKRRTDGATTIIVRGHAACRAFLCNMAMCFDPAGHDQLVNCVNLVLVSQVFAMRNNASVLNADVGPKRFLGGY